MKKEITHNEIGEIVVKHDNKIVFIGSENGEASYPGIGEIDHYNFTKKEIETHRANVKNFAKNRNLRKVYDNLQNERPLQEGVCNEI